MAGRKKVNRHAIKRHRNYSVEEAARVLGVAKGTVRRWIKGDLPAITDRKPILILGEDLSDYLKARARPKSRCGPGECYCFKCRAPRPAAEGMADFIPQTSTGGNLRALCGTCGTLMHRQVSNNQLKAFSSILDVSVMQAPAHIRECPGPCLNDHFEKESKTHA
jgi:excisionase family DNA binding protein